MSRLDLNHLPTLPQVACPIAICGAGGIVNDAHLPAYRKAGFAVTGIYDQNREAAERTAQRFEVPRVYETLEELAEDPDAAIIDIAVPATETHGVVSSVVGSGKALLIQKPLGESMETARATVDVIEQSGVVAAVNQQMRWEPGVRAAQALAARGDLGEVFDISFSIFVDTPWNLWEWLKRKNTIDVLYHSIHYLDSIRFITGKEPVSLYCDGTTQPGYDAAGETRILLHLVFEECLRATVRTNHHAAYGLEGQRAEFRVDGTRGVAIRTIGLLMDYPKGVADAFSYKTEGAEWRQVDFAESWFPDAFVGPVSSLMRAMTGEIERPETGVRDNLKTLGLVFGAYESMHEGRVVNVTSRGRSPSAGASAAC